MSRNKKIEAIKDALQFTSETLRIPGVLADPDLYRIMVDASNYLFSQYAGLVLADSHRSVNCERGSADLGCVIAFLAILALGLFSLSFVFSTVGHVLAHMVR